MASLLPEEVFEDHYTDLLRARLRGRALEISYRRDRAKIDIGFHLTKAGSLDLSGVKVWFQLKGIHAETLSAEQVHASGSVPVSIKLEDLRFWYASPEAVYLVVYVEALNEFFADDVRDVVEERWGADFFSNDRLRDQESVTIHLPTTSVLDDARLAAMSGHQSMRIDGPPWRGRPLGHRLDPLRCELEPMIPGEFEKLVLDLLDAHGLQVLEELPAHDLIEGGGSARLMFGQLYNTWEWTFQGGTEFGFDEDTDFRIEGPLMCAHGDVAVLIHSEVDRNSVRPAARAVQLRERLQELGAEKLLVFTNAPDLSVAGSYRAIAGELFTIPQGLGSLSFNTLTATLVYLDHREHLRWRHVNYR